MKSKLLCKYGFTTKISRVMKVPLEILFEAVQFLAHDLKSDLKKIVVWFKFVSIFSIDVILNGHSMAT